MIGKDVTGNKSGLTQEQALEMYPKTGILILLNLPKGLRLGLDNISFEVGSKFMGFKLIPVGLHYFHWTQKQEQHRFVDGKFLWFTQGEIQGLEWDHKVEAFRPVIDKENFERLAEGAKNLEIDAFLGPYSYEQYELWKESCCFVTKDLLKKILIQDKKKATSEYYGQDLEDKDKMTNSRTNKLASAEEVELKNTQRKPLTREEYDRRVKELLSVRDAAKDIKDIVEDFEELENAVTETLPIKLVPIPKNLIEYSQLLTNNTHNITKMDDQEKALKKPTHQQVTEFYTNKVKILDLLIKKHHEKAPNHVLGEFQLSFILFMIGQNFTAFSSWKEYFNLLTTNQVIYPSGIGSESLESLNPEISKNLDFWVDLVRCLFGMLKQFPKDFFYDVLSKESFVRKCLINFFNFVEDLCSDYIGPQNRPQVQQAWLKGAKKLRKRTLFLKKLLIQKFDFDVTSLISDDTDDDLPVVVDNPTQFYKI